MDFLYTIGIAFDAIFVNHNDINPSCFIFGTHANTHETFQWHHRLAHFNIIFMKIIQIKAFFLCPLTRSQVL